MCVYVSVERRSEETTLNLNIQIFVLGCFNFVCGCVVYFQKDIAGKSCSQQRKSVKKRL